VDISGGMLSKGMPANMTGNYGGGQILQVFERPRTQMRLPLF
jgi:hypothetical protein